jgi:hypothetical protein
MKKLIVISSLVVTAILVLAFATIDGQNKLTTQTTVDFIIIRYNPFATGKGFVSIHYGGDKIENIQLTKEEMDRSITNYIIDRLSKFNSEGYELVSATSPGASDQITCFLRKK